MGKKPVETTLYSLAEKAPEQPQRRADERYLSLLRVGALMIGDRRELCLIRNISAGGMMIRPYAEIPVGTRVSVELKHGEPVSGVVRWVDDGSLGVEFDSPIDVLSLIAPATDGPRPRMPRVEVDCVASVREGADVHRVVATNVSQGGLCIETAANLTVGGDVVVTLPGLLPAAGVVKWRHGELYGIGFNRVLALAELVPWLQQQQQQQDERRRAAG